MLEFPSITPPDLNNFDEDFEDNTISSISETKYRISRPRTTRMPGTWTLGWSMMKDGDYQSLLAFWHAVHGTSEMFTWINPKTGATHTVRFLSKSKFKLNEYGWSGTVGIEEV